MLAIYSFLLVLVFCFAHSRPQHKKLNCSTVFQSNNNEFNTYSIKPLKKIKDALLTKLNPELTPDVVVVVDWRYHSKLKWYLPYMGYKAAAQNSYKIGSQIENLVSLLVKMVRV